MDEFLSDDLRRLGEIVAEVTREHIAPKSLEVDRECYSLKALAEAGGMGLHVPRRLGGTRRGSWRSPC